MKAHEWVATVEKAEKAAETVKKKRKDIETAKSDITRGGKECHGMEKELDDIRKKKEKVRVMIVVINLLAHDVL